jgi:hypothetical protein
MSITDSGPDGSNGKAAMPDDKSRPEQCCLYCRWLKWMIALGQGVQCSHPLNANAPWGVSNNRLKWCLIPSLSFCCEHFAGKPHK